MGCRTCHKVHSPRGHDHQGAEGPAIAGRAALRARVCLAAQGIDKDGSGTITVDELKEGLRVQGSVVTEEELTTLVGNIGADNSGTIDYEARPRAPAAGSALRSDRGADRAVGKINRRADHGTGENGHLVEHWPPVCGGVPVWEGRVSMCLCRCSGGRCSVITARGCPPV